MRAQRTIRWGRVSIEVRSFKSAVLTMCPDAMEYLRAKTVDLPKRFLDRGRI